MKCPVKEQLQEKCTAVWNDYVTSVEESGLSVDPRSGIAISPSISELASSALSIDPATGTPAIAARYSAALRMRGQHLKASRELSKHLSKHRC
jgi:hypothetical protein